MLSERLAKAQKEIRTTKDIEEFDWFKEAVLDFDFSEKARNPNIIIALMIDFLALLQSRQNLDHYHSHSRPTLGSHHCACSTQPLTGRQRDVAIYRKMPDELTERKFNSRPSEDKKPDEQVKCLLEYLNQAIPEIPAEGSEVLYMLATLLLYFPEYIPLLSKTLQQELYESQHQPREKAASTSESKEIKTDDTLEETSTEEELDDFDPDLENPESPKSVYSAKASEQEEKKTEVKPEADNTDPAVQTMVAMAAENPENVSLIFSQLFHLFQSVTLFDNLKHCLDTNKYDCITQTKVVFGKQEIAEEFEAIKQQILEEKETKETKEVKQTDNIKEKITALYNEINRNAQFEQVIKTIITLQEILKLHGTNKDVLAQFEKQIQGLMQMDIQDRFFLLRLQAMIIKRFMPTILEHRHFDLTACIDWCFNNYEKEWSNCKTVAERETFYIHHYSDFLDIIALCPTVETKKILDQLLEFIRHGQDKRIPPENQQSITFVTLAKMALKFPKRRAEILEILFERVELDIVPHKEEVPFPLALDAISYIHPHLDADERAQLLTCLRNNIERVYANKYADYLKAIGKATLEECIQKHTAALTAGAEPLAASRPGLSLTS